MVKFALILVFISVFLEPVIISAPVELEEDDSIEIPVKSTRRPNSGLAFLRPADDAIFNFINKLVNTSYLSSKMMVNRVKAQSEVRKEIEDQVEEFLENLPSAPIPIVDDLILSKRKIIPRNIA
ncbi:uncharacterized protein LOC130895147 [Diorhabda carinulata]|uniref:uncharacterized protein LOC130895147 n=1 Tax=Diorhabda carinulata TaxID=1163345 RepID=UPI0025A15488|nr:uncharacterized protein LOC130895147 [Diorhabda carinulata]